MAAEASILPPQLGGPQRARRLRRGGLLAFVMLAAGAASAQQRPAATPTIDELIRLQQDLRGREQQRQAWASEAEETRAQIAQLNADLARLSLTQAQGELSVNDKRLRLQDLSARETELSVRVGQNRNRLSRLLGALQMYSRNPPPALFVHPSDAKDAVRAAILIRAVTPELERRAKAYAAEVEEFQTLRRQVAAGSAELFTAESAFADQKSRLEAMIAEKTAQERQLSGDLIIADREIAVLTQRAQTLSKLLGGLPARQGAQAGGRPGKFRAPAAGPPASRFAERGGDGARSEGWTWRTAPGSAVQAPSSGVVEYAGPLYGWGQVLILRLAGDYRVVLAGLGEVTVKPGQSVAEGQSVGRMALAHEAGVGSGLAELYLEVRNGNRPVDPAQFLN